MESECIELMATETLQDPGELRAKFVIALSILDSAESGDALPAIAFPPTLVVCVIKRCVSLRRYLYAGAAAAELGGGHVRSVQRNDFL